MRTSDLRASSMCASPPHSQRRGLLLPMFCLVFAIACGEQPPGELSLAASCTPEQSLDYSVDIEWPESVVSAESQVATYMSFGLEPGGFRLFGNCETETVTPLDEQNELSAVSLRCYQGGAILMFDFDEGSTPITVRLSLESYGAGIHEASAGLPWTNKPDTACSSELFAVVERTQFQYVGEY